MILTCPNCETQYFADDSTIGESGRTVKCAACGHSWFVSPPGLEMDPDRANPTAAHEIYRERVREQRRRKSRTAALLSWMCTAVLFFALGVAAIMFRNDVVKVFPRAAAAYKMAGFTVNRFGIEFADIERSRTFNDTDSGRHRLRTCRERGPLHRRYAAGESGPGRRARPHGRHPLWLDHTSPPGLPGLRAVSRSCWNRPRWRVSRSNSRWWTRPVCPQDALTPPGA
jgi:predicted Zn finger-like uncharacterized protein